MPARIDFARLSLMDALDLAILIEVEAHERYKLFTEQLGRRYPGDASSIFASMAENEAKHGKDLLDRRKARFGNKPMRVSRDDLFDVEAPDLGAAPSRTSPLGAFQVALASERKAHDFYDEALGHVSDPDIRTLFTELRDEEIDHVRLVQEAIAKLPPGSELEPEEDEDELPAL